MRLGRWHEVKVGPHDRAMFQIAFEPALFADLTAFLMLNHGGVMILVHPNTANERRDHIWKMRLLDRSAALAVHGEILREDVEAEVAGEVNTAPTLRA